MPTLHFKGKTFLQNYHHAVKFHNLEGKKDKSLTKEVSLDDNLVIHGDNLKALKALLPTHSGKVKCVYIDPPYNTGNESWVYNDNVASPMLKEWLGKVVARDDLTRHDKWCCMMYPRLTFLRELLSDDGMIFISIDDNEVHHLRMMMDEIFGDENFRNILISRRFDKNINTQFLEKGLMTLSVGVEYVLVYGKTSKAILNPVFREASEERQNSGYWKGFWNAADRPTMRYEILGAQPSDGQWKWKQEVALNAAGNYEEYLEKFSEKISLEEYWEKTGKSKRFIRRRSNLVGQNMGVEHWVPPSSGILRSSNWSDILASENLNDLGLSFDSPKNLTLIQNIIKAGSDDDSIILDSFAGSGTTGHAVLALNKEDGGNRKFILVECEDYADKTTAERLRRAIKGIPGSTDKSLKQGLGGSFSYFELGDEVDMDRLLEGKDLPSFENLAKYAFFTATGEKFDHSKIKKDSYYIGSSSTFEVFLMYSPDKKKLKELALNLEFAEKIQNQFPTRQKLVFAPACFMEDYHLKEFNIRFAQLPFEIYRMAE